MSKKMNGKATKALTHETINQEYNYHAPLASHKLATIKLLEDEVTEHVSRMCELRKASASLPPPEKPQEPQPPKAA